MNWLAFLIALVAFPLIPGLFILGARYIDWALTFEDPWSHIIGLAPWALITAIFMGLAFKV